MGYLEFKFSVEPLEPGKDILISELDDLGFEGFRDDEYLFAYIREEDFDENSFADLSLFHSPDFKLEYSRSKLNDKNWNEVWESNFEPISVAEKCYIRAPFHKAGGANYEFEIVIDPKMSFGTGHHDTTYLMIKEMLSMNFEGKSVLDMGSGTGVLGILAGMMGAEEITAVDIDEWAYENARENFENNEVSNVKVLKGDASLLKGCRFNIILANINRNILVEDIPAYAACLDRGGELLLSGFMEPDAPIITEVAASYGLNLMNRLEKGKWLVQHCKKEK